MTLAQEMTLLGQKAKEAARLLEFEHAAFLRDQIQRLERGEDPTMDAEERKAAAAKRRGAKAGRKTSRGKGKH